MVRDGSSRPQPGERLSLEQEYIMVRDGSFPRRKEESWAPMEALARGPEAAIRTRDVATLAQIEKELFEVEEQLVSKKIAERLPVSLAAKSPTD